MRCISVLMVGFLLTLPDVAEAQSQSWRLEDGRHRLFGETSATATASGPREARISIGCDSGHFSVGIKMPKLVNLIGDTRTQWFRVKVPYQIDDDPAVCETWRRFGTYYMALDGDPALALAYALHDAKSRFVIRDELDTAEFDLAGAESAISKVLAICRTAGQTDATEDAERLSEYRRRLERKIRRMRQGSPN